MKKTSLIGHVVELLDEVRLLAHPADQIVRSFYRSRHYLGSRDRRFITEALFGIIRNLSLLQAYIEAAVKMGKYSLTGRIPSIAFYSTFDIKIRGTSKEEVLPDVAGLWRIYLPEIPCESFLGRLALTRLPDFIQHDPIRRLATTYSIPASIVQEWHDRFGLAETEKLCGAMNEPAPTTVRVNTLKTTVEDCQRALRKEGVESIRTSLSPFGLLLEKRVNIQSLKSFKRGYFEMQDEGSQLLSMLTEALPGATVVDACAGGGGKTLHLAALMNDSGSLYSIDVDARRLDNIRQRLERAGVTAATLLLASRDAEAIQHLHQTADAVLIDAPCTGTGTFRRNPSAKFALTEESVERMSRTQHSVLEACANLVRPGGRLVYCTCTLLQKENEDAVVWFMHRHSDFSLLSAPEILARQGVPIYVESRMLTLFPYMTGTDGFFAAVLERQS